MHAQHTYYVTSLVNPQASPFLHSTQPSQFFTLPSLPNSSLYPAFPILHSTQPSQFFTLPSLPNSSLYPGFQAPPPPPPSFTLPQASLALFLHSAPGFPILHSAPGFPILHSVSRLPSIPPPPPPPPPLLHSGLIFNRLYTCLHLCVVFSCSPRSDTANE